MKRGGWNVGPSGGEVGTGELALDEVLAGDGAAGDGATGVGPAGRNESLNALVRGVLLAGLLIGFPDGVLGVPLRWPGRA
ncbi:MAG: hypothetical protein ACKO38_11450, partial [Planctomycetota bacterium]